jgi:tetrahydromethanopterin S-methyltransferase subunit G
LNNVDRRLDRLETTLETRFGAMDQRFNWLTGIVVGTWITTILTVLFRH